VADKNIDEAIKQLQLFIKTNKSNKQYADLANKQLANCLFAKEQIAKPGLAKVYKIKDNLNADAGDYALCANGDKYWFTSSRTISGSNHHLNQLFFCSKDSGSVKTRLDIGQDPKGELQYAAPSLEATGKRMYFTIWHKEGTNTVSGIYLSRYVNRKWSAPQVLNKFVNAAGYNAMQPCVTADGKHLFFASNQPGGMGGTDIWQSDLDIEGEPVNAANLGSKINTGEDEQAPFYSDTDHKLIYSSKGFVGLGGFDLFESVNTNNQWSAPQNMGYPINSTKDDMYYYPDNGNPNIAFISSDRESDCCLNLFKVHINKPKPLPPPPPIPTAVLTGLVIDCATTKPLPNVIIDLTDSVSMETVEYNTTATGRYQFKLLYKHAYTLKLVKNGYFAKIIPVQFATASKTDTLFNPIVCQQEYEINKPIVIDNILYAFNKYDLKPEAKTVLDGLITILHDNPKIKVELSSHTDSFGPDWSNNRLSQNRAEGCVNYIISKGIPANRILAKGYGKTQPVAPNTLPNGKDNPPGRKLNRRTEFKVVSSE
jgi:OOP family OmpA-OmpF porin